MIAPPFISCVFTVHHSCVSFCSPRLQKEHHVLSLLRQAEAIGSLLAQVRPETVLFRLWGVAITDRLQTVVVPLSGHRYKAIYRLRSQSWTTENWLVAHPLSFYDLLWHFSLIWEQVCLNASKQC